MNRAKAVLHNNLGELLFPATDVSISEFIREHGFWEPDEVSWMNLNVFKGATCVNVGAHTGVHALHMSRLCTHTGKVFAFEPSPEIFSLLKINITNSKLNNLHPINSAVGRYVGTIKFFPNSLNSGMGICYDPSLNEEWHSNNSKEYINVKVVTIDSIFMRKGIDILVIDAEGFEPLVLEGATKTIKKFRPSILMEYTPMYYDDLLIDESQIIDDIVFNLGYQIEIIGKKVFPSCTDEIRHFLHSEKKEQVNISLLPKVIN